MLRSILIALDGSPHSETATRFAIEWARRFDATLVGVAVIDASSVHPAEPVPMGAGAYKRARDETRLSEAQLLVRHLLDEFEAQAATAGCRAIAVEDTGDPGEQIVREAHRCDLVLLGNQTHFHLATPDRPDGTLAHVLRASPRPLVIVPRDLPGGHGVLVAYGGGREAARTLQTVVLLGLVGEGFVDVLTLHRDGDEAEAIARRAGDYLATHGVACRLHPVVLSAPPAQAILREVEERRPRLLVMGAYGHHPVRDLFASSITRAVLGACPVPVVVGA